MEHLQVYNVATINVKTQGHNFKRKNLFTGEKHVKVLAEFIRENALHSVGTQELTSLHQKALQEELGSAYQISGGFRFGNGPILEKIPYNESNAIITDVKTIQGAFANGTSPLPSFPTKRDFIGNFKDIGIETVAKMVQKRIATYTINESSKLLHINTHLSDSFSERRAHQELCLFQCIFGVITSYPNYDVILTGDFNDSVNQTSFQQFLYVMQGLGFQWVPIEEKTYSKQSDNVAIDHIFISKGLSLADYKVCDTGDIVTTTDHYPVLAKIYKNEKL